MRRFPLQSVSTLKRKGAQLVLLLCLLPTKAQAVVFEVTTAEEFQAALSAAASNGGDDEILLSDGIFQGHSSSPARMARI